MNKFTKLFLLGLSPALLGGCSPVSNQETSSSVSSSTEEKEAGSWDGPLKSLMKEYCGEVLPFPKAFAGKAITYEEAALKDGTTYLEIKSEANSFTLKKYYETLAKADWNLVKGYGDFEIRESNSLEYAELTKGDEIKGYDITYYYQEASSKGDFEGNVICCYNNLNSAMSASSSWTAEEKSSMKETLAEELPYLPLGEGYSASATGDNDYLICDTSLNDLRKSYSDLLIENGFTLDEDLSLSYGFYILTKTLEDGSAIAANLDYGGGNYFTFSFNLKIKKSSSWPSAALSDIEKAAGVSIPGFEAKGQYYSATKNGKVYIYAMVDKAIEYDTDYLDRLGAIGLVDYDGYGEMHNWEETLSLTYGYFTSGNAEYFEIIVSLMDPVSEFTSAWPSDAIDLALKKLKADVSFPAPALPELSKQIKYSTETRFQQMYEACYEYVLEYNESFGVSAEDKEAVKAMATKLAKEMTGVDISFYDEDEAVYKALDSYYYSLGYHKDSSLDGYTLYEDPTGKTAIYFYTSNGGVTNAHIGLGSGIAHSPYLTFAEESYTLGAGTSTKLALKMDMLPYGVTYSLSDDSKGVSVSEEGVVTIASDAAIGNAVTLVASVTLPNGEKMSASCQIIVADRSGYDYKSAMDAVVKLFNGVLGYAESDSDALYTCYDEEEDYYWVLYNYIPSKIKASGDQVKEIVKNSLIPEGFALSSDWESGVSSHGFPEYTCTYVADGVTLEYTVTLNPDDVILVYICSYEPSL